jgi:hypothetical protein
MQRHNLIAKSATSVRIKCTSSRLSEQEIEANEANIGDRFDTFEWEPPPYTYTKNHPFSPIARFTISWACLVHKMYSLLR